MKDVVEKLPLHIHPDVNKDKEIFITQGNLAFAISIYQIDATTKKREMIQFWSKGWSNNIENYSNQERLSLCVRQVTQRFLAILIWNPFSHLLF